MRARAVRHTAAWLDAAMCGSWHKAFADNKQIGKQICCALVTVAARSGLNTNPLSLYTKISHAESVAHCVRSGVIAD